ncbi:MAG TPA: nucleotide-binding protein [Pyrinomonadaceae bacterium]|nr:nucleotide-binding protein [Pyrinomonadaceae bacterium]
MKPKVFIGSSSKSLDIAYEIQEQLADAAVVVVWKHLFELSNYTLESLIQYSKEYDFGVFIFAADDMVEMNGERLLTARDNVVFELGLFVGRLGRDRSFLVTQETPEKLHLPGDLEGLNRATFNLELPPGRQISNASPELIKGALGPACSKIRKLVKAKSTNDEQITPLSGGMVYILRHLERHGHALRDLARVLAYFQTGKTLEEFEGGELKAWIKAAQYACQCLFALGLVNKYGGDEYVINGLGEKLLRSEKMAKLHGNTLKKKLMKELPGRYGS